MEISSSEQDSTDFDWFCADESGEVGHFTTAGFKRLPGSVSSSSENLVRLKHYFETNAPSRCGYVVDRKPDQTERYLRSFVAMASRGLYSYDIETYLEPGICYFRVATPLVPLRVDDLPDPIRRIVEMTLLRNKQFSHSSKIAYEETLII